MVCQNCLFKGKVNNKSKRATFIPDYKLSNVKKIEYMNDHPEYWHVCDGCKEEVYNLFEKDFQMYYNRYLKSGILLREYNSKSKIRYVFS